jgi:carnitine O-palmitoyltransferase 2
MMFSDPKPVHSDQIVRSAVMIRSALRMKKSLEAQVLEPDIFYLKPQNETPFFKQVASFVPESISWYVGYAASAFPLDMSQYKRLFSTTRIPRATKDELVTYETSRHIAVLRNGHFYVFDVISNDGYVASTAEIYHQLKEISSDKSPLAEFPIAVLTCEERDIWAAVRQDLEVKNSDVLKKIDSAIFILCLDDEDCSTPVSLAHSLLHGNGWNRWLDKSLSMIVDKAGRTALNFEHSWGDGVCVLRFMNEVYADSMKSTFQPNESHDLMRLLSPVTKLQFSLDSGDISAIKAAKDKFQKAVDSLTFEALQYAKYGRDFIKSKMAPGAIMQLSFQVDSWCHLMYTLMSVYMYAFFYYADGIL